MAESEDMVEMEWDGTEELGVCLADLKKMLDEEEERLKEKKQRSELRIQCLKELIQQNTYMVELHENAVKALEKFKVFWKDLRANLGIEYPETDSEEEDPSNPMEVIETPDEDEEDDDDVMSLDSADISRMAKEQPQLHEVFLDLRKLAQDVQNFMDVVKTKLGSLDASAAMAESKDAMEEVVIDLDDLKQEIDEQLEMLKNIWWHFFGNCGKFHF